MKTELAVHILDVIIRLAVLILAKYAMNFLRDGRMRKFAETVVWAMEQIHAKPGLGKVKKEEALALMQKKFKVDTKEEEQIRELSIIIEGEVRRLNLVQKNSKKTTTFEEEL